MVKTEFSNKKKNDTLEQLISILIMRYINQSLVHIIMLLFHRHIDLYDCFKSTIALEDKHLKYTYIVFCFVLR